MRQAFDFGRLFLLRPSAAADSCAREKALGDGLRVYAVWLAASLLYLRLKPLDFPDAHAVASLDARGLAFWSRVALWEPVLAALEIALTGVLLRWMREGWLPLKTAAATVWIAVPVACALACARGGLPRAAGAAVLAAWAAPGVLMARRLSAREWRTLAAFLLGLNALALVLLAPQTAAVALRSQPLFNAALALSALWLLASGGLGLRRLAATSAARAVLAFLFANLALSAAVAAAFVLGLLPVEVLKVLVFI